MPSTPVRKLYVAGAASSGGFDKVDVRPEKLVEGPFTNLDVAQLLQIEGGDKKMPSRSAMTSWVTANEMDAHKQCFKVSAMKIARMWCTRSCHLTGSI